MYNMAVVIATTFQFTYKRNFSEKKWEMVGNHACKLQVKKKSGEFYLHITGKSEVCVCICVSLLKNVLRCG